MREGWEYSAFGGLAILYWSLIFTGGKRWPSVSERTWLLHFFCVLEICDKAFPFLSFWNIFPLVKGGIFNLYPQIWFSRWAKPLDSSAWLQRQPVESVSGDGEGELQRLLPGACSCPSPLCSVLAFPLQGEDKCGNHYSLYHFEALAGLTGWFGSKILSHWTLTGFKISFNSGTTQNRCVWRIQPLRFCSCREWTSPMFRNLLRIRAF